jgi:Holin of 3TMs, for gene-transfer release
MFGVDDLVNSAIKLGTDVIDRVFPDPAQAAQAKIELFKLQQQGELAKLAADTEIVKKGQDIILAEANAQSWLTKNWRPIVMITFTALIVARWLGWSAPNLQPAEYLELWAIVKLGLGGYVIGRSAEKIVSAAAPQIAGALK